MCGDAAHSLGIRRHCQRVHVEVLATTGRGVECLGGRATKHTAERAAERIARYTTSGEVGAPKVPRAQRTLRFRRPATLWRGNHVPRFLRGISHRVRVYAYRRRGGQCGVGDGHVLPAARCRSEYQARGRNRVGISSPMLNPFPTRNVLSAPANPTPAAPAVKKKMFYKCLRRRPDHQHDHPYTRQHSLHGRPDRSYRDRYSAVVAGGRRAQTISPVETQLEIQLETQLRRDDIFPEKGRGKHLKKNIYRYTLDILHDRTFLFRAPFRAV